MGRGELSVQEAVRAMPDFYTALEEALERQYQVYEPYQTLCEMEGVRLNDLKAIVRSGELQHIPAIPADWFKGKKSRGLFKKLSNLQSDGRWLISSATSGDPSYTWRTQRDRQAIADSFARAYQKVPSCKMLVFSPDPQFLEKAGKRFAIDDRPIELYAVVPTLAAEKVFDGVDYMARLNLVRTLWIMAKTRGKGRPVLDLQKQVLTRILEEAERTGSQIALGASVLMLYPAIKNLSRKYNLGGNVYFVTGAGGWEGKKGTLVGDPIDKPKFIEDMCEKLGIPEDAVETNFWDIYGTTENGKAIAGAYSREFGDFVFEVEGEVKLYVIDPVSGKPAKEGEKGFPRFISPIGVEGFAGGCVQQSDLVTVVSLFDDGSVHRFTHISRASGDEGPGGLGCAYEMVEGVRM